MKTFKFWKDNKLDQEYTLTPDEIKHKYLEFLRKQGKDWVEHNGYFTVSFFIGDREGLSSVSEEHQALQELLKDVRHQYYNDNY